LPPDPRFFTAGGPFTIEELAEFSGAEIFRSSSPARAYESVAPLDEAVKTHVGFLDNYAYISQFAESDAGCLIAHPDHAPKAPAHADVLTAEAAYLAYARVATAFYPEWDRRYIPETASERIHASAQIADNVVIGAGTVIGPNAEIGAGSVLGPNAYIGDAVKIGRGCRIGQSTTVRCALVGNNVTLFAGVCIGEPGFGFAPSTQGAVPVPQVGRVLIGDEVEVGANTTIDRGAGPDTVIGDGTRIDNLVQIGHNVKIGRMCIVVSQTGIAGSTKLGDGVQIGGQVGISGHVNIGTGAKLAARTGVMSDVEAGATVAGMPAVPIKQHFRQVATLSRLAKKKES
jgi:UDP-3-O-[3-hydroxymyristoyl] glucosamine N-acyltransferase